MSGALKPILILFVGVLIGSPAHAADDQKAAPPAGVTPAASAAQEGSVESFFQLDPLKRRSAQGPPMLPAGVTSSGDKKSKSPTSGFYRCIWRVLDDAGVPMFFGQDACIDPSISGTYLIASPKLPRERAVEKELEDSITTVSQPAQLGNGGVLPASLAGGTSAAPTNAQPEPQKIPAIELEGVTLPTPRDDAHAPPP